MGKEENKKVKVSIDLREDLHDALLNIRKKTGIEIDVIINTLLVESNIKEISSKL
jgi:hypothetical protein